MNYVKIIVILTLFIIITSCGDTSYVQNPYIYQNQYPQYQQYQNITQNTPVVLNPGVQILSKGTVTGKIIDSFTKKGISGVTIEVEGVRPVIQAISDETGNFKLINVPSGRQSLIVSKEGYTKANSGNIIVNVVQNTTVTSPLIELIGKRSASDIGYIDSFGGFKFPRGLSIDRDDNIYVVDFIGAEGILSTFIKSSEVKKMNSTGSIILNFGSSIFYGNLGESQGIGVDPGGNVFVADTAHNAIKRFGTSGKYIGSTEKGFSSIFDIAVLSTGDIVVSDPGNARVALFDSSFGLKRSLGMDNGPKLTEGVRGITVDNGDNIYVIDSTGQPGIIVTKYDREGNRLPLHFGKIGGIEAGSFNDPTDLAIDNRNGDIYVVDSGNNRVQRFDAQGNYVSEFGSFGIDKGQFNSPWGICIDKKGYIYVSDSKNGRVQKFFSGTVVN